MEDEKPRKVDGYQPQANIRSHSAAEKLQDPTYTCTFSSKLPVKDSLVQGQ